MSKFKAQQPGCSKVGATLKARENRPRRCCHQHFSERPATISGAPAERRRYLDSALSQAVEILRLSALPVPGRPLLDRQAGVEGSFPPPAAVTLHAARGSPRRSLLAAVAWPEVAWLAGRRVVRQAGAEERQFPCGRSGFCQRRTMGAPSPRWTGERVITGTLGPLPRPGTSDRRRPSLATIQDSVAD